MYYLSHMARLTDITLYDEFHPREGQRHFQQRANYVGELYWQCLHGYKPPKTTRISITLVSDQQHPHPLMVGSLACVYREVHAPTYDALSDPAKLRYWLEHLHEAVCHLCQAFQWNKAVLARAYQRVLDLDLEFRFAYPEKVSRDGKKRAYLLLRKDLMTTHLFACIDGEGGQVQVLLHEGPNRWWYDPVYHLVHQGKWFTNAQFGVHATRPYFRASYSLQLGTVGAE